MAKPTKVTKERVGGNPNARNLWPFLEALIPQENTSGLFTL